MRYGLTEIESKSGDGKDGIQSDSTGEVEETQKSREGDDDPDSVDRRSSAFVELAKEAKVGKTVISAASVEMKGTVRLAGKVMKDVRQEMQDTYEKA